MAVANYKLPQWVPRESRPLLVGRSRQADVYVPHPTVSGRHALLRWAGETLTVEDLDSKFGTYVNGVRVRSVPASAGDRVQFGAATVYRVDPDGLKLDTAPEGLDLAAQGLRLCREGGRTLVEGVDFQLAPDSFAGILGPSGAGKSTLLNCLAGYLPYGEGTLQFDGQYEVEQHLQRYRTLLGHVPQDDHLLGLLTVRENLAYAAWLRCGVRDSDIDRVLDTTALLEHADKPTVVLSGGQRKRLSVAFELLKRPRLLLLDEPTAGLDPAGEAHLMEQLRQVANRGTTVICTTHLMDNLHLVDTLVVLGVRDGVGRLAYLGSLDGLLAHFGCKNFADVYKRLATGRFEPLGSDAPGGNPPRAAQQPTPSRQRPPGLSGGNSASGLGSGQLQLRQLAADLPTVDSLLQVAAVGSRAALVTLRDRGLLAALVAQPLALGLLTCLTQYRASSLAPLLFFAAVIAIWLGLNNSARDLVRERRLYVRERLAGLRPGPYLGAKSLVHLLVGAGQIALLLMVLRLLGPWWLWEQNAIDLKRASMLWYFTVLMTAYAGGLAMGLCLSSLVKSEAAAVAALPLLIMPQLMLSGMAAGLVEYPYTDARPFRPLAVTLTAELPEEKIGVLVDLFSLGCFSRPATLAMEAKAVRGYSGSVWLADFFHLLIMVLAMATITCAVFQRAEQRWSRLIGIG